MRILDVPQSRFYAAVAIALIAVLGLGASVASAIESEGEFFTRDRMVGNLGVAFADVGVYPDRAEGGIADRSSGNTSIDIPAGAEVVDVLVYWAGRGDGWTDTSINVNGTAVTPDDEYSWTTPDYTQTTYVADLGAAGLDISPGTTALAIDGIDSAGQRAYGVGIVAIYSHPSLPEVELELLEGNEFSFYNHDFSDDIGHSGLHTQVACSTFAPALEARTLNSFVRIMGVDAGRSDGPPRTQRLQWWTGTDTVVAPIADGLVGIPATTPAGSVDNPVTPKVANTEQWGSETFETNDPVLGAGETHFCNQVQSLELGDGLGASLGVPNMGASGAAIYRLGNLVWADANADGMADLGEAGIDGVAVELWRDGADSALATTTTADDGAYLFEGLTCGTYRVVIPGGQTGQSIGGEAADLRALAPTKIVSSTPDDDTDNDSNGNASDGAVASGPITIGDCGDDGDFSNDASAEPTNETNRKGGPDDDPDEVDPADGNYDDVRSNVTVDFAFTPCGDPGPDGADPVDADGEPCNPPCGDADGDGTADEGPNGEAAVDADGEPCNPPCGDTDGDGTADEGPNGEAAVDADGEPCNPPCGDTDGDGTADEGPNGEAAVDADGEPCNPPCADADGDGTADEGPNGEAAVDADGEPCNPPCGDADGDGTADEGPNGEAAVDADGEPCNPPCADTDGDGTADEGPNGEAAVDADGEPCNPEKDPIEPEVQGQVEINPDADPDVAPELAITGASSNLFALTGLLILVAGLWLATAGAWLRPLRAE